MYKYSDRETRESVNSSEADNLNIDLFSSSLHSGVELLPPDPWNIG